MAYYMQNVHTLVHIPDASSHASDNLKWTKSVTHQNVGRKQSKKTTIRQTHLCALCSGRPFTPMFTQAQDHLPPCLHKHKTIYPHVYTSTRPFTPMFTQAQDHLPPCLHKHKTIYPHVYTSTRPFTPMFTQAQDHLPPCLHKHKTIYPHVYTSTRPFTPMFTRAQDHLPPCLHKHKTIFIPMFTVSLSSTRPLTPMFTISLSRTSNMKCQKQTAVLKLKLSPNTIANAAVSLQFLCTHNSVHVSQPQIINVCYCLSACAVSTLAHI